MKKPHLYMICLSLMIIKISIGFTQNQIIKAKALADNIQPVFYQLSLNDRLNYTLTANQPIKIKRDTFMYKLTPNSYKLKKEKRDYLIIPIKLMNNSNDTLRYVGMSCSWWDIYLTDTTEVKISQPNEICYKNGLCVITIAPKDSSVVNMAVDCSKTVSKFKIGMILQKYDSKLSLNYFIPMAKEGNTIWSNEINIP